MTKADKIRGLSTNELAFSLLLLCPDIPGVAQIEGDIDGPMLDEICKRCPFTGICPYPKNLNDLVSWLESEAEDER